MVAEMPQVVDRAGEIGALTVASLLPDQGAIKISQSVWHGKIQTVKSKEGNRICEISPPLGGHLRRYVLGWKPNPLGLLFASSNRTPWDIDTVRRRKLYPLLEKLGIERCGFHAFAMAMQLSWTKSKFRRLHAKTGSGNRTHVRRWDIRMQCQKMAVASRRASGRC